MECELLIDIVESCLALPRETEWVEFKHNNCKPDEIGEYISAISNACALYGRPRGYIIWGVNNETHEILGTTFYPHATKIGEEELENWLHHHLEHSIEFQIEEYLKEGKRVVVFSIQAAHSRPVRFKEKEYIRVGSYKKLLRDFIEKERELWVLFERIPFEAKIAKEMVSADKVLLLIDYPNYFYLFGQPLPENREGILEKLVSEGIIYQVSDNYYNISNVGALLFAKNLEEFGRLGRKSLRIIIYEGNGRIKTKRERMISKGYAVGYTEAVDHINELLPRNEEIGMALRREVRMYPEIAIRELVANALIHQDFSIRGTGPMVEIFDSRVEITNPGRPLVQTDRFLDKPPKSRNEALAAFLRRMGISEERGTGIDKIVFETELYQLPAPLFEDVGSHTRSTLFARQELKVMSKDDRIRSCYLHACLRYVQNNFMTNTSLRTRFGIEERNSAIASRLIKEALEAKSIKMFDANASKKYMKYLPHWA